MKSKRIILIFILMLMLLTSCSIIGGMGGDGTAPSEDIINDVEPDAQKDDDIDVDIDKDDLDIDDVVDFQIVCVSGTANAYQLTDNVLTFSGFDSDSCYQISGKLDGNIIIDAGNYELELEMIDFSIYSDDACPVLVQSGSKVLLSSKKGSVNTIFDDRASSTTEIEEDAAIYALCDLTFKGKGTLNVNSTNYLGIHTKDNLKIKSCELNVKSCGTALKGNDEVEITSGNITAISTTNDGIKTTNTDLSKKDKQKGNIIISGGVINIYSACDGIDAACNVVIEETKEDADTLELNINTDKYSAYSEEVTAKESNKLYIKTKTASYKYSIYYFNSNGEYKWVNSGSYTQKNDGGMGPSSGSTYYYLMEKNTNYDKFMVYMYAGFQDQGQDTSYYARSSSMTINNSYDTISLNYNSTSKTISCSWTNYSTTTTGGGMGPGGMGPGGMQEGNSDKGEYSTKGIKSGNEITINSGTIKINAYDDAVHANNESTLDSGNTVTGNLNINGGTISIYSNDDGLHADGIVYINDGIISISNAYEGVEGTQIYMNGGSLSLVSKDDGFNATASSGEGIIINGGYLFVYAGGDGLDANTKTSYCGIIINGGTTVVISTGNADSSLDTEKGYKYTGGELIAIGRSGGMSSESTNCQNFSSVAVKTTVQLTNSTYITVKEGLTTSVVVKCPTSMSALVIYLGSSSAKISTATSTLSSVDANGVYWG